MREQIKTSLHDRTSRGNAIVEAFGWNADRDATATIQQPQEAAKLGFEGPRTVAIHVLPDRFRFKSVIESERGWFSGGSGGFYYYFFLKFFLFTRPMMHDGSGGATSEPTVLGIKTIADL